MLYRIKLRDHNMKPMTERVISLRKSRMTYKQISQETGLSKGNISYLCNRYVPENPEICAANVQSPSKIQLDAMRIAATEYYRTKRSVAVTMWKSKLEQLPEKMLYYISGLYDGEGNHTGTEFSICNSDQGIIERLVQFFAMIEADITISLYLHGTHDRETCVDHWAWFNIDSIYQYDVREQSRDYSATENHGTINIRVKKPLGLRDALHEMTPI